MRKAAFQILVLMTAPACNRGDSEGLRCGEGTRRVAGECVAIDTRIKKAPQPQMNKTTNSLGMVFVEIPAGKFAMGMPAPSTESFEVTLTKGLLFQDTEVTRDQWVAVLGERAIRTRGRAEVCGTCPIDSVRWVDAVIYANTLSAIEGLKPAYEQTSGTAIAPVGSDKAYMSSYGQAHAGWGWDQTANGYRLPTEAEWEYAALAGRDPKTIWAAQPTEIGWTALNSGNLTYAARLKAPNPWGIYDMLGNVKEWCWDAYAPYSSTPATDPQGPLAKDGRNHVLRGYSFKDTPMHHWPNFREKGAGTNGQPTEGFRLVRNLP